MPAIRKVLISTIHPSDGGIPTMLRFVIDCLQQRNYQITLAYYRPYSLSPDLSVPLHKVLFGRPSQIREQFYGVDCVGLGCWLPELEVTHYWSRRHWEALIKTHDAYMVVSGSCMAALAFVQTSTPFLGWVASDWQGDRAHRVTHFPFVRRLVDRLIISPLAKKLEKKIINSKQLVALSEHTRSELNGLVGKADVEHILSMPVDTNTFVPNENQPLNYKIGFVGRFEDPRKHIDLLLTSFAKLVNHIPHLQLVLVGDTVSKQTAIRIKKLEIENSVITFPNLGRQELADTLKTLDLFVLPSYQEGLCIAALEAMSSGLPVISTRCGGPESYITDGVNGYLCEQDATAMSSRILELYSDEKRRMRYAMAARQTVIDLFSIPAQTRQFWRLFDLKCQT